MSDAAEAQGGLEQFAEQWRAEDAHDARKVAAKVDAMNAPAEAPPAAEALPAAAPELVQLSAGVWSVLDRLICSAAGADFRLTPDEVAQLAAPTAAVVAKYMPDVLQRLTSTPEGVLLGTVAIIYGPKAAAMLMAPPPAPPAPAPVPEVVPA